MLAPYLEAELFDFLSSLPAALLLDHTFHTDTIAHSFPQWAGLPYAEARLHARPARRLCARFAADALSYGRSRRLPPRLLLNSYVLPRLCKHALDGRVPSWFPYLVYWMQLQADS